MAVYNHIIVIKNNAVYPYNCHFL